MSVSPQDFEHALLDVRKAFRLLYNYQRLALDAASYLGAQLGFSYIGGWPKFSDASPKPGKGSLTDWSWTWLNLYLYEFHFEGVVGRKTPAKFSVLLISDTGYYLSRNENADACDLSTFLSTEQSSTKIGLLVCAGEWPDPEFINDDDAMRTFIETGGKVPEEYTRKGVVTKCCDFARLLDEASTSILLDEFIAESRAAGVMLARATND